MADSELLDAREAMQLLGINEADLQTLVARGDLRAFRSAGTMKFRRDDVSAIKAEKATEPTIIIPAASSRKQGASGILPTVGSGSRPGSRIIPAVAQHHESAPTGSQTSDIVLDDIELDPLDAGATQQVTVEQSAIKDPLVGGATIVDGGGQTGSMTIVEGGVEPTTGPQPAVSGSGRRNAIGSGVAGAPQVATPAMSRVRAAVAPGVSMATSKRTLAVYQAKTASPIWTGVMILTSIVLFMAMSVCGVMMTRGGYDAASGQRIIPPFLAEQNPFNFYQTFYDNTPGRPKDKKPEGEYGDRDER
jgi:multisubunit Na+/H+ antiporter MnhC subunit